MILTKKELIQKINDYASLCRALDGPTFHESVYSRAQQTYNEITETLDQLYPDKIKIYKLHWKNGITEIVRGKTFREAMVNYKSSFNDDLTSFEQIGEE